MPAPYCTLTVETKELSALRALVRDRLAALDLEPDPDATAGWSGLFWKISDALEHTHVLSAHQPAAADLSPDGHPIETTPFIAGRAG